jgi:arylsulfate sulfotransferase
LRRRIDFIILLFLACACSKDTVEPDSGSEDSSTPQVVPLIISVELEEFEVTPLSRAVHVELSAPGAVRLEFWQGSGPHFERQFTAVEASQSLPLLGLRSASETHLIVHAQSGDRSESSQVIDFETAVLGFDSPVVMGDFAGMDSDGSMVLFKLESRDDSDQNEMFMGVDRAGEIVWAFRNTVQLVGVASFIESSGDGQFVYRAKYGGVFVDALGQVSRNVEGERLFDHDLAVQANGSLLMITQEARTIQTETWGEIQILGSELVEVDSEGKESWSWSTFDHMDTERYPNTLSGPKQGVSDWTHLNSVQYIEERNQILVSVRNQSQVLLIDRATGDVVWTLGEDGDFELLNGSWFSSQHDASMQPDGSILLYDNGNFKTANPTTRVVRYVLDAETLKAEQVWELDMGVYMNTMGGVIPLDNGNFQVTLGGHRDKIMPASVVEVTPDGQSVWEMKFSTPGVFWTIYRSSIFQFAQVVQ